MEPQAYTIPQFCDAHGFSRAHFFNLKKAGKGPREMKVGARVLISREAAEQWRRDREAEANAA